MTRVETEGGVDGERTTTGGSLGQRRPQHGAAGEVCSLDNYLAQPDESMDGRIAAAREKLGGQALILGHHYQRDEVIRLCGFYGRQL